MRTLVTRLAAEKKGVTAIEYGLIAGAIAIVIIVGVTTLGGNLSTLFNTAQTEIGAVSTKK
jgi:pilus assembly protein Flp/PilA